MELQINPRRIAAALHHNGLREGALVSLEAFPDFLGVIMPWCSQATFKAPPLPTAP